MAKVSRIIGEHIFPERRLLLQSSTGVHHVALPGWLQAMLLAASLGTIGAVAYLCVGFIHLHDALGTRGAESAASGPAVTRSALTAMASSSAATAAQGGASSAADGNGTKLAQTRGEIDSLSQQIAALTQQNNQLQSRLTDASARVKAAQEERDDAERRAKANEQAVNSRAGNAEQLVKTLEATKGELQQSEIERTTLQNRVQQLQMDLQAAQAQPDARSQQPPQPQVAADPQHVAPAPVAPIAPAIAPDAAPPERKPAPTGVPHAQSDAPGASSELEKLLASTGVDIDRMLQALGSNASGEGGPYIALNDPRAAALDRKRLDDLQRLAKMLPLAAPLNQFTVGSEFGPRVDPINHRPSFHPGLDLDAPYLTSVYSTAPGIVIFTGNMDSYGKVVEIDHGHGIMTRYAHLHRILVAKGQKVVAHTAIGELGSTGRSTGPHLHYEVHVDGVAVDPAKFMQAGKNVVQVSGQQ